MGDDGATWRGETVDVDGPKLWVLTRADRRAVAGVLLVGLFGALVVLGTLDPSPLERSVVVSDPVETLFQSLVAGVITGVTLVLTINQLVISQELGPLADQRERVEGAMAFREDVEEATAIGTSPVDPGRFLAALVAATGTHAEALAATVEDTDDESLRSAVDRYADHLIEVAAAVQDDLERAHFGTFAVVWNALRFDYSRLIFEGRTLQSRFDSRLPAETRDSLASVIDVLTFFAPAREHFKTLYFQWELVDLSRDILYTAIPALIVASSMILYYDPRSVPGATLGVSNDVLLVSGAATVAVVPFVLLLSYVLRIATVAKLTLAAGPFVLRRR